MTIRNTSGSFLLATAFMATIVTASNILVQYPINGWLTWGAFSYPVTFLVTDLINRKVGVKGARRVVYVGFATAVMASLLLATPRIAAASGSAFLVGQLLDVTVFNHLRHFSWWKAPVISSTLASILDTVLFFSIAFAGTNVPWVNLAVGDFGIKMLMALTLLVPFRAMMNIIRPQPELV